MAGASPNGNGNGNGGLTAEELRGALLGRWELSAAGWERQHAAFEADTLPVAQAIVARAELSPGDAVLEVAAGLGSTGLLAAEAVAPTGSVVLSDAAEAMVELLSDRAKGRTDVEVRQLFAEALRFETASVDRVLSRWGYMLLVDPVVALQEARRVLRPGGRIVLAAWAGPDGNEWTGVHFPALRDRGLVADPARPGPHMFAWADPVIGHDALLNAGFVDVVVERVEFVFRSDSVDDWWDARIDLSPDFARQIAEISPEERDELLEELTLQMLPFTAPDGAITLPAATHIFSADI